MQRTSYCRFRILRCVMTMLAYYVWFISSIAAEISDEEAKNLQYILSSSINATMNDFEVNPQLKLIDIESLKTASSKQLNICDHSEFAPRFSCCLSQTRYLFNVMIQDGKFIFFDDSSLNDNDAVQQLPPIASVLLQQIHNFNMPIKREKGKFSASSCNSFFDGTLHVIGRRTVKNVYHTMADNVLLVVANILIDAFIMPDFLHLPRTELIGFFPNDHLATRHINLIDKLMTKGTLTLSEASNICFRRVVWGQGPSFMYFDALSTLRRLTSKFMRNFVYKLFDLKIPSIFSSNAIAKIDGPFNINDKPLNIVLFTRGNSGFGRSIKGEDLLVEKFRSLGAIATICCDFASSTLEEQIAHAYYADIIIGLHGAALVQAIFSKPGVITLELKTSYGYTSTVFFLVSEAKSGLHSQVDIREYRSNNGHRPIDNSLINRVMYLLNESLLYPFNSSNLKSTENLGDFLVSSNISSDGLSHIYGPNYRDSYNICKQMIFNEVRSRIGEEDSHCNVEKCNAK